MYLLILSLSFVFLFMIFLSLLLPSSVFMLILQFIFMWILGISKINLSSLSSESPFPPLPCFVMLDLDSANQISPFSVAPMLDPDNKEHGEGDWEDGGRRRHSLHSAFPQQQVDWRMACLCSLSSQSSQCHMQLSTQRCSLPGGHAAVLILVSGVQQLSWQVVCFRNNRALSQRSDFDHYRALHLCLFLALFPCQHKG